MTRARPRRAASRAELIGLISKHAPDAGAALTDETPLISSGLLESLGLLEVALWVEARIDPTVDFTTFDLSADWDTVASILDFVEAHRPLDDRSGTVA